MKQLRKKAERPNNATNIRVTKRSYGVYIYIAILSALPIWFSWILLADYFRFQAQGEVVTDSAAVETAVVAQVEKVYFTPGERIKKGQLLFKITSIDHLTKVAALTAQLADMKLGYEERRERANVAASQKPVVESEISRLQKHLRALRTMRKNNLVGNDEVEVLLQRLHALRQESERLESSAKFFAGGIEGISELETRLLELDNTFSGGEIRAGVEGIADLEIAKPGEVVTTGERLTIINTGQPYIIAYLPEHYLCEIYPGMEVDVQTGNAASSGAITDILPLADKQTDPQDLTFAQNAKPKRIAKIKLERPNAFPIGHQVALALSGQNFCFRPLFNWIFKADSPDVLTSALPFRDEKDRPSLTSRDQILQSSAL